MKTNKIKKNSNDTKKGSKRADSKDSKKKNISKQKPIYIDYEQLVIIIIKLRKICEEQNCKASDLLGF